MLYLLAGLGLFVALFIVACFILMILSLCKVSGETDEVMLEILDQHLADTDPAPSVPILVAEDAAA